MVIYRGKDKNTTQDNPIEPAGSPDAPKSRLKCVTKCNIDYFFDDTIVDERQRIQKGLEGVRNKKLLYHLTRVDNMEMIINHGLLPRRCLIEHEMFFEDVADPQIISKREELGLDIYTPFHFHPYSAFDVAVKNTYSTEKFVYICIKRALAEFNDFKILIKHPLSQQDCILYNYKNGIKNIDWDTMERVGGTDEYSRNVKMAECLTNKCIPAELFQCVYVPDTETQQYIEKLFQEKGILEQPPYMVLRKEIYDRVYEGKYV